MESIRKRTRSTAGLDGQRRPEVWLDKQGKPRFDAWVYLGRHPVTGQKIQKQETFRSHKEAKDWVNEQKHQRKQGYRPTTTKVSFAAYLTDTWLPHYRTQVRSTYTIEKTLGKHILNPRADFPFLGTIKLHDLTTKHFNDLYAKLATVPDPKTQQVMQTRGIGHLHGILKRALKAAVETGELIRNPAAFAKPPKRNRNAVITNAADEEAGEVQALSQEQATRLRAVVLSDRYSALWHLLLTGGLRPGEAFALKWRHVDFANAMVKVRGTLARVGVDKKQQGWEVREPKTDTSSRDVPLPAIALQELRRWKKQQAEDRLRIGPEWQDHEFVFTTETGTPLGNNMGRAWERVLSQADGGKGDLGTWGPEPQKPKSGPTPVRKFTPRFVPYVLRHTCATLLLLNGVELLEVSRRLGHTDLAFTARTYGHVRAEHGTKSAAAFDRMFGT